MKLWGTQVSRRDRFTERGPLRNKQLLWGNPCAAQLSTLQSMQTPEPVGRGQAQCSECLYAVQPSLLVWDLHSWISKRMSGNAPTANSQGLTSNDEAAAAVQGAGRPLLKPFAATKRKAACMAVFAGLSTRLHYHSSSQS